jgi:hypothetical protein
MGSRRRHSGVTKGLTSEAGVVIDARPWTKKGLVSDKNRWRWEFAFAGLFSTLAVTEAVVPDWIDSRSAPRRHKSKVPKTTAPGK